MFQFIFSKSKIESKNWMKKTTKEQLMLLSRKELKSSSLGLNKVGPNTIETFFTFILFFSLKLTTSFKCLFLQNKNNKKKIIK